MDIERIDPGDRVRLAEAYEVLTASSVRAYDTPWTWQEFRESVRLPDPWLDHVLLLVRDEHGDAVAAADVGVPTRDNTDQAWPQIWVRPGWLPSDAADALLDRIRTDAQQRGRRFIVVMAAWDLGAPSSPMRELLERAGYELAIENGHRVLDLPVDETAMTALAADASQHHRDYALRAWRGRCPDEWVEPYAGLRARMLDEAPRGATSYGAEDFGSGRVRLEEDLLTAQRRVGHTTVAVDEGGTVAGHSQLVVPGTDEVNAYQWDTLVLPEHRGHRLGLALKAHNLLAAAGDLGSRTRLHTWNAVENAPMVAVNERLGYRLVEYAGEFQYRV